MASKPVTRAAHAKIKAAGGEDYVFAQVAEGRTLKDLAQELGVSRQLLSAWANAPARRDALTHARQEAAGALMDEALAITDGAEQDPMALQKVKLQSDLRKWLAARMAPGTWSMDSPQVQLTIQQLHLEAVKQVAQEARRGELAPPPRENIPTLDSPAANDVDGRD